MITFTRIAVVVSSAAFAVSTMAQSTDKMSIRPAKKSNIAAKQEAPPATATTIDEVIEALRAARISAEDVTDLLTADEQAHLDEDAQFYGGSEANLLKVDFGTGIITAWLFEDAHSLDVNLNVQEQSLGYGSFLLLPIECSDGTWAKIERRLTNLGAVHAKASDTAPALVMSKLQTIRGQFELYLIQNRTYPPLAKSGWKTLIADGYLPKPPANVLSTSKDQASIAVVHQSGLDGSAVEPNVAGWLWNAADEKIYPAGYTEDQLRETLSQVQYWREKLREIQYNAAVNGTDRMKIQIINRQLNSFRSTLRFESSMKDLQRMAGQSESGTLHPSLRAVQQGLESGPPLRPNPFNGSDTIQAATWNADNPPVTGDAGWNYDENTGTIWANTLIADAHRQ